MTRQSPPNKEHIAKTIRACRKKKKWSQTVLADFIGVSRQTVYQWERAKWCPKVLYLYELMKLFNLSVEELIGL